MFNDPLGDVKITQETPMYNPNAGWGSFALNYAAFRSSTFIAGFSYFAYVDPAFAFLQISPEAHATLYGTATTDEIYGKRWNPHGGEQITYDEWRALGGNDPRATEKDLFFSGGWDTLQGGVYTINQVLGQYGYPSREEYLFPKPTFFERLLNFGVPLDREDLAEKVIEAVSNEWDLIHQNLDVVGLDRLKLYRDDLWSLRFNLMSKVEDLNSKVVQLQGYNPGGLHNSEIISLTNLRWDLSDQLIPVNRDYHEVTNAINFKVFK